MAAHAHLKNAMKSAIISCLISYQILVSRYDSIHVYGSVCADDQIYRLDVAGHHGPRRLLCLCHPVSRVLLGLPYSVLSFREL